MEEGGACHTRVQGDGLVVQVRGRDRTNMNIMVILSRTARGEGMRNERFPEGRSLPR